MINTLYLLELRDRAITWDAWDVTWYAAEATCDAYYKRLKENGDEKYGI